MAIKKIRPRGRQNYPTLSQVSVFLEGNAGSIKFTIKLISSKIFPKSLVFMEKNFPENETKSTRAKKTFIKRAFSLRIRYDCSDIYSILGEENKQCIVDQAIITANTRQCALIK